jgi:carboxyl-terminal processing protease
MKYTIFAALGGAAMGVLAATQLSGPASAQQNERSTYEYLDLFGDIFERVRSQYVEEVDEAELIESAINGMLTSLDPHSSYLAPKNFEDMRVQTKGEFGGLGI